MVTKDWTLGGVRITRAALDIVEKAARDGYARNEEACGYIAGPATDPLLANRAVELENLANKYHQVDPVGHPRTGHDYFKINGLKFERALAEGDQSGNPIKVFFHSHLDCGSYFSEEDAASMTMGDGSQPSYQLSYLVTAVDKGVVTNHRLFIWEGSKKAFVEAPFSEIEG